MGVLVVDIGGTTSRFGWSSDGRRLQRTIIRPTPQRWSVAKRLIQQSTQQLAGGQRLRHVVVGFPSMIDQRRGRIIDAPFLPDWSGRPVRTELRHLLGALVMIENDAALGGLGEAVHGAGRGHPIVAYITIGTGVGGARIVRQRIDQRARGFEPGHQIILRSANGRGLTLERLVSGSNIRRRFHRRPEDIVNRRVWRQLATALALGLVNVCEFWSPDVIVLGGGVMAKYANELQHIRAVVARQTSPGSRAPIRRGRLGDEAGLWGGLALLVRH